MDSFDFSRGLSLVSQLDDFLIEVGKSASFRAECSTKCLDDVFHARQYLDSVKMALERSAKMHELVNRSKPLDAGRDGKIPFLKCLNCGASARLFAWCEAEEGKGCACPGCGSVMARVVSLRDYFAAQGVEVVGVQRVAVAKP